MSQDQRQILLGKPALIVDQRTGGQGLNPSGEAIACRAKFGIGGIVESSHVAT